MSQPHYLKHCRCSYHSRGCAEWMGFAMSCLVVMYLLGGYVFTWYLSKIQRLLVVFSMTWKKGLSSCGTHFHLSFRPSLCWWIFFQAVWADCMLWYVRNYGHPKPGVRLCWCLICIIWARHCFSAFALACGITNHSLFAPCIAYTRSSLLQCDGESLIGQWRATLRDIDSTFLWASKKNIVFATVQMLFVNSRTLCFWGTGSKKKSILLLL